MIIIPGVYNAQTHVPGGSVQGQTITVGAILKVTEKDRRPYPTDVGTPSEIWIDNTAAVGYVCKEVGPNGTVWDRLDVLGDYIAFGDSNPGVNADILWGFRPGSLRYARNTQTLWICTDNAQGAAVWSQVGSGGSGTVSQVDTGTGLSGGPITNTGTISLNSQLAPAATLTGNAGNFLRVNALETAVEYVAVPGGGDMLKATYDVDNDGIVDKAERVEIIVRNSTGSTLTKGQIVYLFGATGNRPNALLSDASTEATSSKTIGMVVADIANNADGFVAVSGTLHDLATNMFSDGDSLWLGTTPGGMVANTPPAEPNHAVFIGYVARAHPTQGRVVLKIQNGYELNELHGVLISSEANNDLVVYESSSTLWKNKSLSTILGYTPLTQTLANTNIFVGNASSVATAVAMSGDATLANTGILTIANNAVTYAKMQAVSATSRLLGSSDTTTPIQEITLGTNLSMTGTTLNATGGGITALTGDVTASGSGSVAATVKANLKVGSCGVTFDGGGQVIQTKTAYVQVPYNGTLTSWTLVADVSGSCTITVFKDTYANFPPTTTADDVYVTAPSLSSQQKNQNLTPTYIGSQATVTAGDYIGFTISAITTITWANLTIQITKT